MTHRFTMKELNEWPDEKIISIMLSDRLQSCTNMYAPLPQKIGMLRDKLETHVLVKRGGVP